VETTAVAAAASVDPQWFFALVNPHLANLREVAGRVLRYVEARGEPAAGEL